MPGLWVWLLAVGVWALAIVILLLTLPVRFDRTKLRLELDQVHAAMDVLHEELGLCRVIAQGVTGWRLLQPGSGAGREVLKLRVRLHALMDAVATAPPTVRETITRQAERLAGRANLDLIARSEDDHARAG